MINGYIGPKPFATLSGNPQWEQPAYVEITKPWERGHAFSRQATRTDLIQLVGEVDLLFLGQRQVELIDYANMVGFSFQILIREGAGFITYPGLWKVLHVEDITEQTKVAVASGGIQSGTYILTSRWDLARLDIT